MDNFERNYKILESKMIDIMNKALDYGNKLIETELNLGFLDFLAKPLIKTFYNYWKNNDAKKGTLTQIKTSLDCGKILALNGNDNKEYFDELIEKNFFTYLTGDQVYMQCNNHHRHYPRLKEIIKETFISQVKESAMLIRVKEEVDDYNSLIRAVFKTKEKAYEILVKQIDFTDECIKIVEKDISILKIPTGRNLLIKTLRKGFNQTRINLINNLDNIYN